MAALACTSDTPQVLEPSSKPNRTLSVAQPPSPPTHVLAAPANAKVTIAWRAPVDSGSYPLVRYRVTAHPSGKQVTVPSTQIRVTMTGLTNGTAYYFTVRAISSNGIVTLESAESQPSNTVTPSEALSNKAPTASISAPASGTTVAQGTSVKFTGSGTDPEDGALSGASLVWTSSINGQIGTGTSFTTSTLSAGSHTITLTAKDSKGATGKATISLTVTASAPAPSSSRWVTGYYVGYQRSMYPETSVDFTHMTHVIVGAVEPTSGAGLDTTFFVDNTNGPRMARNLTARAHSYGRKAIVMLGGASFHDRLVTATSSTYRASFVSNLVRVMNGMGFDGIDVDWEPINTADKPTVIQFLKDLRAAKPGLIITFPVGWVNANWGADSWYAQVAPLVDQFNMMTYEMADNWGGWVSWHHAALAGQGSDHPSSIASSAAAYVSAGVPAAKIGIGVGTYGSCWQGDNTMLAKIDGTPAGVTASDNAMTYANIMSQYYNSSAYKWDATASMGYLSFSAPTGPQQCTMISYEDPRSVTAKGAYVKSQGLGGAIVWTLGEGHVPTATAGQQDPLVSALFNAMQ